MAGKLFISYRREDSRADARSIYQRLSQAFGADRLFMDVDTIQKGSDFTAALDLALAECKAMLVVIGRNWVDARDGLGQRRLDDPGDFVRQEVAAALRRDIPVIPVRIDGAQLPQPGDLPDDLKPLVVRQSAIIMHENFARDMDGIERAVRPFIRPRMTRWLWLCLAVVPPAIAIPVWLAGVLEPNVLSPCLMGRRPFPEAAEVAQRYAQLLSSAKNNLHYQWAGGLQATTADLPSKAPIVDAFADGNVLVIRYDWQSGILRLTPVERPAGYSKYVTFAGDWTQRNGKGCVEIGMILPELFSRSGEENLASGIWTSTGSAGAWSARIVKK